MQATPPPSSKPEDEPIWIRRERERELQAKEGKDLPFGAYLLFSAMVAIAAVRREQWAAICIGSDCLEMVVVAVLVGSTLCS